MTNETLYLGDNPLIASSAAVQGDYVTRDGESYYRIANVDGMDDFFISVVSDSNHWMFISTRRRSVCRANGLRQCVVPVLHRGQDSGQFG